MTIESATYISDLNTANPGATDIIPEGDDHLRLIKTVLKNTLTTDGSGNVSTTKNFSAANLAATTAVTCSTATATSTVTGSALIPSGASVPTNGLYLKAANNPAMASNTTLRWDVNSTGNHSLAAPSSGVTVAVTGVAAGTSQTWTDGTRTAALKHAASRIDFGSTTGDILSLLTADTRRIEIGGSGNITANAPSSGITVTVNGVGTNPILDLLGTTTGSFFRLQRSGTILGDVGSGDSIVSGTSTQFGINSRAGIDLVLGAGNTIRLSANATTGIIDIAGGKGKLTMAGAITRFESGEIATPAASGTTTQAHGGPRSPDVVYAVLRCKTAELNWAIGDEVNIVTIGATQDVHVGGNATNCFLTQNRAAALAILNKTSGAPTAVTAANWKLVFYAIWL